MPSMSYSLSSFTKTNTDMAAGTSFTAYASGSAISNCYITSGTLYLSYIKTYSSSAYLDFSLGSGSGSTGTFSSNSTAHGESVHLNFYNNALLTAGSGTIYFTLRRTTSGSGNIFNMRDGLTGTLTLNYEYNYSACGAPTAVSVNATNVAPGANVTLSWSGAYAGSSNAITGYQIYRATAAAGTYSLLTSVSTSAGSGSITVTAPSANGSAYYYKVLTVGTVGGYNSGQSLATATLTCAFSATTAPSTVTIGGGTSAYALSGATVVLAWSGADAGTNNPITGYAIYRDGVSYTTTTDTSISVPVHATAGSSYTYTVYTLGTYANSGVSASRVVYTYAHPTAPTSVTVNGAVTATLASSATATLAWSGAAAGANNAITGYTIYRAASAAGAYTSIDTTSATSLTVTAPPDGSTGYYYKVATSSTISGSASALSTVYAAIFVNTPPNSPTIHAPVANGVIYNPHPRLLVTIGTDAEGNQQVLNASGYTASTTGNLSAGKKVLLVRAAALTTSTGMSASLTATDTLGATSATVSRSFTYTDIAFTDSTLVAGTTAIKAVHVNELRVAINNVRAYYGLAAVAWVETVVSGTTKLANWKAHVLEVRTAIDEVVAYVNGWDTASTVNRIAAPTWIDISVNKPTVAVTSQIRQVLRTL